MAKNELNELLKRIKAGKTLVITPRVEEWLVAHPEGVTAQTPELIRVLYDLAASPPSAGRGGSFHSNIAACERLQVFSFLGFPERQRYMPELQNIFNDGTWRHIRWQLMGLASGVFTHVEVTAKNGMLYSAGNEPVPYDTSVADSMRFGLRADAVNFDERFGVELKGTGNLAWVIQNGISPQHLLQIHCYFCVFPELERWVYIAEDKRSQAWREIVIERDPEIVREVANRSADLNRYIDKKELPPMLLPCKAGKGPEFDSCPYNRICADQQAWPQKKRKKLPVHRPPEG